MKSLYDLIYDDVSNYIAHDGKLRMKYSDSSLEIIEYNKRRYNRVSCSDILDLELGADALDDIIEDCVFDIMSE